MVNWFVILGFVLRWLMYFLRYVDFVVVMFEMFNVRFIFGLLWRYLIISLSMCLFSNWMSFNFFVIGIKLLVGMMFLFGFIIWIRYLYWLILRVDVDIIGWNVSLIWWLFRVEIIWLVINVFCLWMDLVFVDLLKIEIWDCVECLVWFRVFFVWIMVFFVLVILFGKFMYFIEIVVGIGFVVVVIVLEFMWLIICFVSKFICLGDVFVSMILNLLLEYWLIKFVFLMYVLMCLLMLMIILLVILNL